MEFRASVRDSIYVGTLLMPLGFVTVVRNGFRPSTVGSPEDGFLQVSHSICGNGVFPFEKPPDFWDVPTSIHRNRSTSVESEVRAL